MNNQSLCNKPYHHLRHMHEMAYLSRKRPLLLLLASSLGRTSARCSRRRSSRRRNTCSRRRRRPGSGSGSGRRARRGPTASVQRGPRNRIRRVRLIDIDQDARIRRRIQLLAQRARRVVLPPARDLQVDALRIVLRAVLLTRGMQRDDLVPRDVVPRRDGRRDRDGPGVVRGDELVGRPGAGVAGRLEALGVDFEEGEFGLVDFGAVALAVGEVGDDGPVVTVGPGRPEERDLVASGNGNGGSAGGGALVADDVRGGVVLRGHEAGVLVFWVGPAGDDRWGFLVLEGGAVAFEILAVDLNVRDNAVTQDCRG